MMNIYKKVGLFSVGVMTLGATVYFLLAVPNTHNPKISQTAVEVDKVVIPVVDEVDVIAEQEFIPQTASLERTLEIYDEWSQYPPDSRPLDEGFSDLINYDQVEEPFSSAVIVTDSGLERSSDFRCRLQPEKHTLAAGDLQQTLSFVCIDRQDQPVKMAIKKISAEGFNANKKWQVESKDLSSRTETFSYFDQLQKGMLITYRNSDDQWGDVALTLQYYRPGNLNEVFTARKIFSISNKLVANFTGNFSEKIEKGSLVVSAEINILESGRYRFDANLKNEFRYLANASNELELDRGRHYIPFLFFGKIFHDKKALGPFILTGARGELISSPLDEVLEMSPEEFERSLQTVEFNQPLTIPVSPAKDYLTQQYFLDSFSDETYQSKEKNNRRQLIQQAISG